MRLNKRKETIFILFIILTPLITIFGFGEGGFLVKQRDIGKRGENKINKDLPKASDIAGTDLYSESRLALEQSTPSQSTTSNEHHFEDLGAENRDIDMINQRQHENTIVEIIKLYPPIKDEAQRAENR